MSNLLIKNARIVDAKQDIHGDILIENGVITKIDSNINIDNYKVIRETNYIVMPSFIDMHTHLRDPGYIYKEDLESGQMAALKGGYTTLCSMANTNPVCDKQDIINYIIDKSQKLNLCNIKQVSAITKNLEGKEIVDIDLMRKYTNLFSDDGNTIINEEIMKKALGLSSKYNFKLLTHCQPEYEIVSRDLKLLENIGGNLHICHISLKDTLELIKKYKNKGLKFTCEVTPHHIFGYELDYKVNPSFGTKEDIDGLIQGIKDGYIDVIGSDHAPHSEEDKLNGSPGISNIEVAFSMVYKIFSENNISLNKLSEVMSYNPANILGINRGLIKEGYIADLVLVDINKEYGINTNEFISKSKNNPFNGHRVKGQVVATIKDGHVIYDVRGTKNV